MRGMFLLIAYTLKESVKRKMVYAFGILLLFGLGLFYFAVSNAAGGQKSMDLPVGAAGSIAGILGKVLLSKAIAAFGGFLSIMVFISTLGNYQLLFTKGEAELILSRSVTRAQFVMGRIIGGALITVGVSLLFSVGIFFITGFRLSYWGFSVLWFPFIAAGGVLSIFACAGIVSSLTKSPVAGLVISYAVLMLPPLKEVLSAIPAIKPVIQFIAGIIPDITFFFNKFPASVIQQELLNPWPQLVIACLFVIINIALIILIFEKKDI